MRGTTIRLIKVASCLAIVGAVVIMIAGFSASLAGVTIAGWRISAWVAAPAFFLYIFAFKLYQYAAALLRDDEGLSPPRDAREFVRSFLEFF